MLLNSAAVSTGNGSDTSPTTVLLFKGLLEFQQEDAVSVVINDNLSIAMRRFSTEYFMLLAGGLTFSPMGLPGGQTLGGCGWVGVSQSSRESNTMLLMENFIPVWNM